MRTWFEDQIKNRLQNDEDVFSSAFAELSSIVMGETAAKAGLVTSRQRTHNAIQEILRYLGQDIIPVPDQITDTDEYINYCLKPSGIMKRKIKITGTWWKDAFGPMLGILEGNDTEKNSSVIALLPSPKGYTYYDYDSSKYIVVNASTAKNIQPDAYCFYKPFPAHELSIIDLIKYIYSVITLGDRFFYISILTVTTVMGLIQPRLTQLLYSYVIPQGNMSVLMAMGVLLITLAISTQILNFSQTIIMQRLTLRLENTVEPATMMRLLNLPAGFFKKYAAGELSQKFSNVTSICSTIYSTITGTLLTSLFSLAYLSQIINITPKLLTPALLIISATLAFNIVTTVVSIKIQKRSMLAQADLSGLTYSTLSGIQKIKLTGSEKRMFARWASKYKAAADFIYNPPLLLKYTNVISTAISAIGVAIVYYVTIISNINVGEYMAFTIAFGMVSASILSLGSITTVFAGLKPQLDIVEPFLKAVPEISGDKTVVTKLSGSIEVQNLTFRYEDTDQNVLEGISIKIRAGQYIAIVGKTGCGKSTLVRLLLGFEKPDKGVIYYDGMDISKLDLPSLRRKIGTVMQNSTLFTGDIFSNIVISAPHLSHDDAWEAARIASLDKDIEDMPMGMHTVITEGSGSISGGQKQRLMIARAVAPKPKILILDESTSALDNITQKHVSDSLAALKCTRIVIAHRLSTIKHCDRIYVLDEGKVIEEGTFDELCDNKGYFHELVKRQMIDKKE